MFNHHNKVSESDLAFVKENYLYMTDSEMGLELKRSSNSIYRMRQRQKLFRINTRHLTPDEKSFIRNNYHRLSDRRISLFLKVRQNSIEMYRKSANLLKESRTSDVGLIMQMKSLIHLCETTKSGAIKDIAKTELRKLSGL